MTGREAQDKRPYTTGEVADLCDVTINAVKKWIASGKLDAFRTPGGHYRINRGDFDAFISKYKLDIKEKLLGGKKRILVVDDDPGVIEYIKGALETMGLDCIIETAGDGYEALIKVGDFKPTLLILDIRMPKIDGLDVCKRLKEDVHTREIRILAVTAYGREDGDGIIGCGADLCLPKPIKLKEFQESVLSLLNR